MSSPSPHFLSSASPARSRASCVGDVATGVVRKANVLVADGSIVDIYAAPAPTDVPASGAAPA